MQTLELECPACGELLELDAGFAGGVCRCSACGTLMTVPHDAAHGEQAEQLSRPERPDDPSAMSGFEPIPEQEPASRPASRSSDRRRSGSSSSRRSSSRDGRRGKEKSKGKQGKGKGKRPSTRSGERLEQGVYQTASGRTVQIDGAMDVPTANTRRTGVRIATFIVFFSIVGLVVAAGAVAVVFMLKNPKGGPPAPDPNEVVYNDDPTQFQYQPSANPFTLEQPNVAGLPINGEVVIILDATDARSAWLEPTAQMIGAGLGRPGSEARIRVYRAGEEGVQSFRNDPVTPNTISSRALSNFAKEQRGTGEGSVAEALRRALQTKPTMLILVTGQPSDSDVDDWERILDGSPEVATHGVLINGYSSDMRSMIRARSDGRFVNLTTSDILNWQDEAAGEAAE